MSNQQLLIEELRPAEAGIVTESSSSGETWLKGIFMQADVKNRNGRVYPMNEIDSAVKSAQQQIKERNGLMGELDHPQSLTVNLDRVSHVITEITLQGNNATGKAKLMNTPMGNIARELTNEGVSLGVSSRGAGTVNESGGVSQYQFVTIDIVAQPSAPNAYPQTIRESLDMAKNGHNIVDLAEAVRHDPDAQQYLKKEIMKWLSQNIFAKNK